MIIYTAKFGDLVDSGAIAPGDLPAVWDSFPAVTFGETSVSFREAFYQYYQNRQIGGETIPTFLMFVNKVTLEVAEMMSGGLYADMLANAVSVEADEERTRKRYPAPEGVVDTAYVIDAEQEVIKRRREYESELDKAEHLMRDGLPLAVWVLKRYEKCFMGVF